MIGWLRRWLGIVALEERVAKLDGHEPEWLKDGGEAEKRREVANRFEPREAPVAPRPAPSEGLGWRRPAPDFEEAVELRRHGGPYL